LAWFVLGFVDSVVFIIAFIITFNIADEFVSLRFMAKRG